MDEAIIEGRHRPYGSKTHCFCPSESKATRFKASLSSPSERNRARSAFLTVFSPYSLRQARCKEIGGRPFFCRDYLFSLNIKEDRDSFF